MAEARICDRCYKTYIFVNREEPDGKVLVTENVSDSYSDSPFKAYSNGITYDLCPDCYKEFKTSFMQKPINDIPTIDWGELPHEPTIT